MASYPIPPWIKPPDDPANAFISAFHAGAAVAGEQAKLQQESDTAATHFAVQQQQLQIQSMRQQQELEMQKAYHEATVGLRAQELGVQQQRVGLSAVAAARKFAAQQNYQKAIEGGMAPDEAALANPELFPSMAGFGSTAKEFYERLHPFHVTSETVNGQKVFYMGKGHADFAPPGGDVSGGPPPLQPLMGPNNQPVPGAGMFRTRTGDWRPYTFPKVVDQNKKDLAELVKSDPISAQFAAGTRPLPENMNPRMKAAYEQFKAKYDALSRPSSLAPTNAPSTNLAPPPGATAPAQTNNPIIRILDIRPAGSKPKAPSTQPVSPPAGGRQSPPMRSIPRYQAPVDQPQSAIPVAQPATDQAAAIAPSRPLFPPGTPASSVESAHQDIVQKIAQLPPEGVVGVASRLGLSVKPHPDEPGTYIIHIPTKFGSQFEYINQDRLSEELAKKAIDQNVSPFD